MRGFKKKTGRIRIIAGQWRSRYIRVASTNTMKPTTNIIRETLFNWIGPRVLGAHCLDAFAGSGALGFEALSRGASHVTFIEKSAMPFYYLKKNAELLGTNNATFIKDDFLKIKNFPDQPVDFLFLDPPFYQNLVTLSIQLILEKKILKVGSEIYIETEKECPLAPLPPTWSLCHEKKTTNACHRLFVVMNPNP